MPYALAADALDLLEAVLDESIYYRETFMEAVDVNDWNEIYCYRHARNIFQLGKEAFFLRTEGHWHAINLILRSQLESLFCLGASGRDGIFSRAKAVCEFEYYLKYAGDYLDLDTIDKLRDLKESIRATSSTPERTTRFTIQQTAEKAGLGFLYPWYRHLSGQIHGSVAGLITSETGGSEGYQLSLLSSISAIATAHFSQQVATSNGQGFIDEATIILEKNIEFTDGGIFEELDFSEGQWKTAMFQN